MNNKITILGENMKAIPKEDFVKILDMYIAKAKTDVDLDSCNTILERYGDDWSKVDGTWTLMVKNERRKKLLT